VGDEIEQRIEWALGQVEAAELAPRQWQPIPQLSERERETLEAAVVEAAPERVQALADAFATGLFEFIPDLFAATYSVHGRRAYHPLLVWKVLMVMMATGIMDPASFLKCVNDSLHVRLFLGVMSNKQLPSARRLKGFLTERLAPAIEYVVLWLNLNLVEVGGIEPGDEFGTDGMEMAGLARRKSDATAAHLAPLLSWLVVQLQAFLEAQGRTSLTEQEQQTLDEAFRQIDWKQVGGMSRSRSAALDAIRDTLKGQFVTPMQTGIDLDLRPRDGPVPTEFNQFVRWLVDGFVEQLKSFGQTFDGATVYDPEGGARTKNGKTVHGFGLQLLNDLKYGFVWAFAVFAAGESFKAHIGEFVIGCQATFETGPIKLTSDREFTIAQALHQWHGQGIDQYGPRSDIDRKKLGIFTEDDFEIHECHAVCPNGKRLKRKPNPSVRGSNVQWRYQALRSDCAGCPLRAQCTTGKGAKLLCINVYEEDLVRQAERMKADPQYTRDLMARHRSLAEGTVNNLKHHQQANDAQWKGLAMARLQLGLAILMANTLKWHKVRTGQLTPVKIKTTS